MPRLFQSGALGSMRSFNISCIQPTIIQNSYNLPQPYTIPISKYYEDDPILCISKQTTVFLSSLVTNLWDLSHSVKTQMEEYKKNYVDNSKNLDKFLFAKIDTPNMNIDVGIEFVLYLQRYGPPPEGKFDPEKLAFIRSEIYLLP